MSDVREVEPAATLKGEIRVPGDKSTSHRALLLAALASGESAIEGLSPGEDVRATATIIAALGAQVSFTREITLVGGPDEGLRPSDTPLDCANSGTSMRLLAGVTSTIEGTHVLKGDASLSKRPMDRVAVPLASMGALIEGEGPRVTAPLRVTGRRSLEGISYRVPVASAQVKSAILFAGLQATSVVTIQEDVRTRRTTEDMFRLAGLAIESEELNEGRVVTLHPGRPKATSWRVPGDPSQAAFFCVLGVIHHDARIEILDIDATPERIGFVEVLQRMGASLSVSPGSTHLSLIAESSSLHATEIHAHEIPSVDEVPVLAVAAAAANGVSAFRDMGELRLKESDRFAGSLDLAQRLGCRVWSEGDDFFIEGLTTSQRFAPFDVDGDLDHRMVMSSAVAGAAGHGCVISGAATVSSSYPTFFDDLARLQ
jgi:3-phosphoshikimate 1-carboxyvinyltransferase